jgi:hypothetical protein
MMMARKPEKKEKKYQYIRMGVSLLPPDKTMEGKEFVDWYFNSWNNEKKETFKNSMAKRKR